MPTAAADPRQSSFWQGFATHIANPKAVLDWSALLPLFLDQRQSLPMQIAVLGLIGIAMDAIVLASYGCFAAASRHSVLAQNYRHWVDRLAGSFFVVLGVMLALVSGGHQRVCG